MTTRKAVRSGLIANTWALEATLAGLAGLSTIAAIIVLVIYDGQPLSAWRWNSVSLNALLSVFSTLSRLWLGVVLAECLGQWKWIWFYRRPRALDDLVTFDEASRGPWGSLVLFWKAKSRYSQSL